MQGNEKNVGHSSLNAKSNEILSVQLSKFTSNLNLQLRNAFLFKKKRKKEVVDHVVWILIEQSLRGYSRFDVDVVPGN